MTKTTGEPAFPTVTAFQGMTLRDYFAAKAMQVYMAEEVWRVDRYVVAAAAAYAVADAMMKEREQ